MMTETPIEETGTEETGPANTAPQNTGAESTGAETATPAATPPDRLSTNPRSPYFDGEILARGVGIRFKGIEKHNVEEYCVSEGWVRIEAGKSRDRKGNPMTIKLQGDVQPYFRDEAGNQS